MTRTITFLTTALLSAAVALGGATGAQAAKGDGGMRACLKQQGITKTSDHTRAERRAARRACRQQLGKQQQGRKQQRRKQQGRKQRTVNASAAKRSCKRSAKQRKGSCKKQRNGTKKAAGRR
jgi:hypothetical protein